jgi:deoxyhypusine synthase
VAQLLWDRTGFALAMPGDGDDEDDFYTRENLLSVPVNQLDPAEVGSVGELLEGMAGMSFQARNLGQCLDVWRRALQDPDRPTVILGVAGSLIAGGMRRVLSRLVEHGFVDVVVSVGSQPYQDLYQAMGEGYDHWRGSTEMDDVELRELFLDRLYDALVDEEKFRETDKHLGELLGELGGAQLTSRELYAHLGERFDDPESLVVQCAETGTPLFCPAVNDSSLGIGMVHEMIRAREEGRQAPTIDPIRDAYELAQVKYKSDKTMVGYIAGGVPKNYIQQTEVISEILGHEPGGHQYAVQITADAPHWGGLSGCTLEEAQSWGKIAREATTATAYCDATIGLTLLAAGLFDEPEVLEGRPRLDFDYDEDGDLELSTR